MNPIHIEFDLTHLSLFFGFGLLVFAITTYLAISNNREKLKRFRNLHWIAENYVYILLPLGFGLIAFATYYWIWPIRGEIGRIISLLEGKNDPEVIRSLAYAIGALLAAVALSATIPFQLIKVWVNERLAKTTEQGHMTDRITKAVEQLGAEKTVKNGDDEKTVPNLEVRLGGIYALSRVARDSPRDHISIMEILCAYIRENFPEGNAEKFSQDKIATFPKQYIHEDSEKNELSQRSFLSQLVSRRQIIERRYRISGDGSLKEWSESFNPRSDLQAIIRVIGERGNKQIEKEYRFGEQLYLFGFRLNLANSNLQGVDFEMLDFSGTIFSGSAMDGALFRHTILKDAFLTNVSACAADFDKAQMQRVVISDSELELCNFTKVDIVNSKVYRTNLNGSFLVDTCFENTELHRVSLEGCRIADSLFIGGSANSNAIPLFDRINAFCASFNGCGLAQLDFNNFEYIFPELRMPMSFVVNNDVLNFPENGSIDTVKVDCASNEEFKAKWRAAKAAAKL